MSTTSHTLSSKIRVLIARTYRAEKLYASMRTPREMDLGETERLVGKLGNDVRSGEWQSAHQELRHRLNEIVRLSSRQVILAELQKLRDSFARRVTESQSAVVHGTTVITEAAKRHEYGHVLKLALELVRHKARFQTCKVILEEVDSVLDQFITPHGKSSEKVSTLSKRNLPSEQDSNNTECTVVAFVPELARKRRASLR